MQGGNHYRQGIIRDTDGVRTLIVWIKMQSESNEEFNISLKKL